MANVLPDEVRRTIYFQLFKHSEMMLTNGNVIANMFPIHFGSSDFCSLVLPFIYIGDTISQYHQQCFRGPRNLKKNKKTIIYRLYQTYNGKDFCCTNKFTHKGAHSISFKVPDVPKQCFHVIYSFLSNFAIRSNVAEPSKHTG